MWSLDEPGSGPGVMNTLRATVDRHRVLALDPADVQFGTVRWAPVKSFWFIGMATGAYAAHVEYQRGRVRASYVGQKAAEDPFGQVRIAEAAALLGITDDPKAPGKDQPAPKP